MPSLSCSVSPVWLDFKNKKMPKFFQKLPRKKSQQFLLKNNVFRLAQKVTTMHLGFSLRKFVTEKFQKSPNLVTLNCSPTLTQICALTPSISLSLSHLQAFPQTFLLLRRALSLSHIPYLISLQFEVVCIDMGTCGRPVVRTFVSWISFILFVCDLKWG